MPLARYFFFVGAVLVALLFVVNAELPKSTDTAETTATAGMASDVSAIRIKSDRKWPERIVFDTRIPQPAAVQTATNQDLAVVPAKVADGSASVNVRESMAQLTRSDSKPSDLKSSDVKQSDVKLSVAKQREIKRPQKRKIARRRVFAPTVLAERQAPFGFFANNIW